MTERIARARDYHEATHSAVSPLRFSHYITFLYEMVYFSNICKVILLLPSRWFICNFAHLIQLCDENPYVIFIT